MLLGIHHDVVHISMNIAPNLIVQTILHASLISCLGTLEPKRHRHIAEGSKGVMKVVFSWCLTIIFI